MASRVALFGALAVTLAAPTLTFAAWAPNGTPLCTASGAQQSPTSASDGSGGMIVAWQDRRRGASLNDIYATRVLGDGTIAPGWPADGVALTQSGLAGPPCAVPDGAGGALVMWMDSGGIYAQRVTGGGGIGAGFPANGKLVTSAVTATYGLDRHSSNTTWAVTDDAGGAYLLCIQDHFDGGLYTGTGVEVIRIGPDAAKPPNWVPTLGVGIGASDLGVIAQIAPGPGGSCLYAVITTEDFPGPELLRSAFAGRIQSNGTEQGQLLPRYLTTNGPTPGPVGVSIAADGAGGHFAFKLDSDGGNVFENQGHHLTNSWAETWPPASHVRFTHYPVSDGGLGVFLVGPTGWPVRIEADYFSSTGTPGWPVGTVVLSEPTEFQKLVTAPLLGGAFACWSENAVTGPFDIRAAYVSSAGIVTQGTAPDGSPICNATGSQLNPTFVIDGLGALAAWEDQRVSNAGDIYANRIVLNTTTAVPVTPAAAGAALSGFVPNPSTGAPRVAFTLRNGEHARLEVIDLAGRVVMTRDVARLGPGSHTIGLDGAPLAAGVYLMRLTEGDRTHTARGIVVR